MIPKNLYALDLGTTKFCLARLRRDSDDVLPFIETVSVKAQGMHRGMLADMDSAAEALQELIEKAESTFSKDIHQVVVGVAGSHLTGKVSTAKIRISTPIVEPSLLKSLKEQLVCDNREALREIIHCVPLNYRLDDREWIKSPEGFSGQFLYGQFFMMEADKHYLSDIIQLCNQTGLEVRRLIAEPFASAAVTSSPDAKKIGIALADIGGGTTDGIIFRDEMPVGAFTINIGGKLMTKDLSIGLGLPYEEAEKVKLKFGLIAHKEFSEKYVESEEKIDVIDVNGRIRTIGSRDVYPILAPRIDELGVLLEKVLAPYSANLGAGLLLTGGGSEVREICNFLTRKSVASIGKIQPKLPESLRNSLNVSEDGDREKRLASKYATVSGLLFLEILQIEEEKKSKKSRWLGQYFGQFVGWLKELS